MRRSRRSPRPTSSTARRPDVCRRPGTAATVAIENDLGDRSGSGSVPQVVLETDLARSQRTSEWPWRAVRRDRTLSSVSMMKS